MNPARLEAVRSLVSIRKNGRYANLELDAALKKAQLNERDSALFTTLVYGTIEKEISLNHYISLFCKRKPKDISPFLRATLQTALYQLCFLNQIPARAVLFESAEIAKIGEKQGGANLVSAVLHAFLRAKETGSTFVDGLNETEKLSVRYAIPSWMIELWQNAYGKETAEKICIGFQKPGATNLFVNLLKITRENLQTLLRDAGVETKLHDTNPHLLILTSHRGDIRKLPGFDLGYFFVQDHSSAETVLALDAQPGEVVADVCAAPGGKAFATAIRMKNKGTLHCSDLHQNRVNLISRGAERLGIDILSLSARDARETMPSLIGKVDRVLCDVPCSGLGVLAKKPDLRHKSREEIQNLPRIQKDILTSSSTLLKNDGRLVYSTCTLNPAENEQVVLSFLNEHTDFSLKEERTIFPFDTDCDGFFYAVLEKQ